MKLLIARFTGGGKDHPEQTDWLLRLAKESTRAIAKDGNWHGITHVGGWKLNDTPITMSRNRAAKYAIDNGFDFLLMLDNDTIPDIDPSAPKFLPSALDFLMARRELEEEMAESGGHSLDPPAPATICAPYCGPPPDEHVYVFEWRSLESGSPNPSFRLEMIHRNSAAFRSGIQEVHALPTGCILYDTRVFVRLPVPWFDYEWTDEFRTEKASTEDVYQTRNASLLGMPQFVHWDCWAGHAKGKMVGKPQFVTRDMVQETLREAITRGMDASDRIVFLGDDKIARSTAEGRLAS